MNRLYLSLSVIFSVLLSLFVCVNTQAQDETVSTTTTTTESPSGTVTKVTETRRAIVTPVPAPKEVVPTPSGYVSCTTVPAGWRDLIWVPAHQVCEYSNSPQGLVWVEGYWGCSKATTEGVCTAWEWKPGRWEKQRVLF